MKVHENIWKMIDRLLNIIKFTWIVNLCTYYKPFFDKVTLEFRNCYCQPCKRMCIILFDSVIQVENSRQDNTLYNYMILPNTKIVITLNDITLYGILFNSWLFLIYTVCL